MVAPRNKLDTLLLFDGIAIFLIVTAHVLSGQSNNPLSFMYLGLGILGLTLFTFSSGYKLMINHSNDLDNKPFLGQYYMKRFIRLYKPYLGYSFLVLIPLFIVIYSAVNFFHLNIEGATNFVHATNNLSIFDLVGFFLLGYNPIANQLWYLITLIAITSVCFTILYFLNVKWLFLSIIPFFFMSLLIQLWIIQSLPVSGIFQDVPMLGIFSLGVFQYLPFFIFGSYWAYYQQNQKGKWFPFFQSCAPVFFVICVISIAIVPYPDYQLFLFCFCCLFFPFFLSSLFNGMKKISFIHSFFMFCGTYAFPIYLFQWPLILPIVTRIAIDLLKLDYIFMPVVVSIVAIYISVFVYQIVKKVHLNILFE